RGAVPCDGGCPRRVKRRWQSAKRRQLHVFLLIVRSSLWGWMKGSESKFGVLHRAKGGRSMLRGARPSAGEARARVASIALLGEQHRGEEIRHGAAEVVALAEGAARAAHRLHLLDGFET